MLRALPDYLAIPGKLVPPIFALLLLVNHHFPSFFVFAVLPFGRPPILPQALSCSLLYRAALVSPPCLPVARKNSRTSLGILTFFMPLYFLLYIISPKFSTLWMLSAMHLYGLLLATQRSNPFPMQDCIRMCRYCPLATRHGVDCRGWIFGEGCTAKIDRGDTSLQGTCKTTETEWRSIRPPVFGLIVA